MPNRTVASVPRLGVASARERPSGEARRDRVAAAAGLEPPERGGERARGVASAAQTLAGAVENAAVRRAQDAPVSQSQRPVPEEVAMPRLAPVSLVLVLLSPASARATGTDPNLHVDPSVEDCSVRFAPNLTQDAFHRFARDGSVSAFKQASAPATLGATCSCRTSSAASRPAGGTSPPAPRSRSARSRASRCSSPRCSRGRRAGRGAAPASG